MSLKKHIMKRARKIIQFTKLQTLTVYSLLYNVSLVYVVNTLQIQSKILGIFRYNLQYL